MTCGNKRSINYGQHPGEVLAYEQSFLNALRSANTTCITISAMSVGDLTVFILNEQLDLATANWKGQFLTLAEGNGIVQVQAVFANTEILNDYFHICSQIETPVL